MDHRSIFMLYAVVLVFVKTTQCTELPIACTTDYKPVCGVNDRTYANECLARSRGVQIAYKGRCTCACPRDRNPVCGSNGLAYDNACLAKCDLIGFTPGECGKR
uniref:Four-domain proteases inhibitor-like n=1 Tax=Crassostrea virginica TaxID=6565 RepID=A0A8B8E535_CRAVI|nr:four-domain proteases inhibitor-like [Crassostrea virginica]